MGFVPDSIKKIKLVLTILYSDAGTKQIFTMLEILLLLYVEEGGLSEWECLDDDETLYVQECWVIESCFLFLWTLDACKLFQWWCINGLKFRC